MYFQFLIVYLTIQLHLEQQLFSTKGEYTMSDADLTALCHEVNFSTPERAFREDQFADLGSENDTKRNITTAKGNERVLVKDSSLTSELLHGYDERGADTISSTFGVLTDGTPKFPSDLGTSTPTLYEDKKK